MTPNPQADFNFPQNNKIFRSPAFRIEQTVCEALNADPMLSACGVLSLPLDSLNIEYEIKNAVSKQGIVGVVGIDELQYIGHNGTDSFYDATINLQVTEQPTINRARASEKEVVVRDEYVLVGGGTTFRPDIVGKTFQMIVQTKQAYIDITTLKREGTFFSSGSSEYGAGNFSLNCRTSDNKEFTVEINNPSIAGLFSRVELSESFVEGEDYEIIDDNFYVFKKPVFVYGSTMRETGDKISLSTVEHQVEKETVYTYACTSLEAAIQGTDILTDPDSTTLSSFGTFCPNGGIKTSNTNAFVTAVSKIKTSIAFPRVKE